MKAKRAWPVIRLRRAGAVYIIVSVILGVTAVNSGNNMLYLLTALMLGCMLASGLTGRANVRAAVLSVSLPDEIYADLPCAATVSVSNKNRFTPIFLIEAALEQEDGRTSVFFPVVQPGRTESRTVFTTFPSRGRRFFKGIELSSAYPFNFFTRCWPVKTDPEAIVFPYPLPCEPDAVFASEDTGDAGDSSAPDPLAGHDIVGVRPYVEGDPMKSIHWKSSAKTGKLKTRLYDRPSDRQRSIIDLDRMICQGTERALSMAAYAVAESVKSGLPIGMIQAGELIPPASGGAHKKALLTRLALYGGDGYGRL